MSKAIDDIATEIHDNNKNLIKMAKDRIFDLIAVGLIIAVGLLSLGAVELRQITIWEIINIVFETIPFYLAAVTLALNFYKKGVYAGKSTDGFIGVTKNYSHKVNKFSGKQLDNISVFCQEYNARALRIGQENILREVAITYERYKNVTYDKDGNELRPLCQLSKEELVKGFGVRVAEHVIKANELKVKGLNSNTLLSNNDYWDITDLGKNENQLLRQRTKSYAGTFALQTFLLTLMGIKDVMQWGWVGLVLIIFKLVFILCRCYMEYFKGYEDITIKVSSHITRKIDILKQFDYWYFLLFPQELDLNDPDYAYLGNICVEKSYNINNDGSKTGDDGTSPKNVIGEQNV